MLTEEKIRNKIEEHKAILDEMGNDKSFAHLIEYAYIQAFSQVLEDE